MSWLADAYLWIKALHLIAVISWMAGLFYLPRLFAYHTRIARGSEQDRLFQTMEAKLLRIIMNPAMIASWIFGLLMIAAPGTLSGGGIWLYVKLILAGGMTWFHMLLARWRRGFVEGANGHTEKFYRTVNEVPTILMIVIVILAIVKPI